MEKTTLEREILKKYPGTSPEVIDIFLQQLNTKDHEIERLNQILLNFQRNRFGQHSEKSKYVIADNQCQPSLFNEAEQEQDEKSPEPTVTKHPIMNQR